MNILFPVLTLLVYQSTSVQGYETTWPAEFKASLSGGGFHQPDFYSGWTAGGSANAKWYLRRPLVDDGTPLSMQGFLQRLDRLSFGIDASGFAAKDDLSLYERRGHSANLSLSGLFYLRDLVLGAGLYYVRIYDFQHPSPLSDLISEERHTTQLAYPELTLGLRSGTFEFQGSYRYRTTFDDGSMRSPTWGQVVLRFQNYSDLPATWYAHLYTLVDGEGVSLGFEYFASPRLGIWTDGIIEQGEIYANSRKNYKRQGLSIGLGWWASSRCELQFSVDVSSSAQDMRGATSLITGLGTFGVVVRAPKRYQAQARSPLADPLPADVIP